MRTPSPMLALPRYLFCHSTVDQMTTYCVMNGDPGSNRNASAVLRKNGKSSRGPIYHIEIYSYENGIVPTPLLPRIVTLRSNASHAKRISTYTDRCRSQNPLQPRPIHANGSRPPNRTLNVNALWREPA